MIELDERGHDLKKVRTALDREGLDREGLDRASGPWVDWECGGRDKATCERLIERLKRGRTRLDCADD